MCYFLSINIRFNSYLTFTISSYNSIIQNNISCIILNFFYKIINNYVAIYIRSRKTENIKCIFRSNNTFKSIRCYKFNSKRINSTISTTINRMIYFKIIISRECIYIFCNSCSTVSKCIS